MEVIPKSILQFSADIRTYTKSPPYLIACLLAPSLNFVLLRLEDNCVMASMFSVKRTYSEAHVMASLVGRITE